MKNMIDHIPQETEIEEKWWQAALGFIGYVAFAVLFVGFIALVLGTI